MAIRVKGAIGFDFGLNFRIRDKNRNLENRPDGSLHVAVCMRNRAHLRPGGHDGGKVREQVRRTTPRFHHS